MSGTTSATFAYEDSATDSDGVVDIISSTAGQNTLEYTGSTISVGSTVTVSGASQGTYTYEGYISPGNKELPVLLNGGYLVLSYTSLLLNSHTLVTSSYTFPCYLRGTMISCPEGERPVEDLVIGDSIVTASGEQRVIRWIGHRAYSRRFAGANSDIMPVLIRAGALADNVPTRDLYVSPLHALYLDGVLIPAKCLINGASILQASPNRLVDYYHIELETHDVIIAEGAFAESYLDENNRGMFSNAHEYSGLYPDTRRVQVRSCAERIETGPQLNTIHARLAERARAFGFVPPVVHTVNIGDGEIICEVLPAGVEEVHLLCDSGRAPGDARVLGALITGLSLDGNSIDLADRCLVRGFQPVEQHGINQVRWTTGEAVLRLVPASFERALELRVATRFAPASAA